MDKEKIVEEVSSILNGPDSDKAVALHQALTLLTKGIEKGEPFLVVTYEDNQLKAMIPSVSSRSLTMYFDIIKNVIPKMTESILNAGKE